MRGTTMSFLIGNPVTDWYSVPDWQYISYKIYISAAKSWKNQQSPSLNIVMVPILYPPPSPSYLIFL